MINYRYLYALVRSAIAQGDLPAADYRFVPWCGQVRACVKGASLTAQQAVFLNQLIDRSV